LGTAAGDLATEALGLGFRVGVVAFGALIAIATAAFYLGADAVLTFWVAYILTRPLGASVGDWLAKPVIADGLGWGTVTTSVVFLAAICAVVAYLTVTKADRIAPAGAES
jgi:uncharacterized membrane-anchored protein